MFIEFKHLRTLESLHETGSLVGAAEQLHLTQSALSHQIKTLESYFQTRLFIRKSRPLRMTQAGQRLLDLARHTLPQIAAAERDLQRLAEGEAGRLHIALECHSCFEWLMPTLDAYRPHWPDIELDISLGFSFDPLPALARGDIDLVITSDPQPIDGLCYEPLFNYQALLAIALTHPLSEKAWIEALDLRSQTLITYPVEHARLDIFTQFLQPGGVHPLHTRTAELTVMMMQLVASGRGVCALPDWALSEYLERDYVAARPLGEHGLHATLYAACRRSEREQAFMQAFMDTARTVSHGTLKTLSGAAPGAS